jgi:ribonuclease Y
MTVVDVILYMLAAAVVSSVLTFFVFRRYELGRVSKVRAAVEGESARLIGAARAEAENIKRAATLELKEESLQAKEAWEQELTKRRAEIERAERRLEDRENLLDKKLSSLDQKDEILEKRVDELERREQELEELRLEYERRALESRQRLERVAGLTVAEAKRELLQEIEEEARAEASQRVRAIKEEATRNAEREARNIVAMAGRAEHPGVREPDGRGCHRR